MKSEAQQQRRLLQATARKAATFLFQSLPQFSLSAYTKMPECGFCDRTTFQNTERTPNNAFVCSTLSTQNAALPRDMHCSRCSISASFYWKHNFSGHNTNCRLILMSVSLTSGQRVLFTACHSSLAFTDLFPHSFRLSFALHHLLLFTFVLSNTTTSYTRAYGCGCNILCFNLRRVAAFSS